MGVPDEVDIKGFDVKQCDHQIQKDGCNCGIITLKVNELGINIRSYCGYVVT